MAQGEGFKHITVTAPEDEDVVIHAGIADTELVLEPAVTEAENVEVPEQPLPPELQDKPKSEPVPQPKATRKPKDDYHETTLEDLQGSPMPLMQKIVIVAAIVCIIGAVIYYFAFMR